MNLFTLLFKLLNTGKIPAYEYQLDGIENFQQSNRMHFKDLLDRQTSSTRWTATASRWNRLTFLQPKCSATS